MTDLHGETPASSTTSVPPSTPPPAFPPPAAAPAAGSRISIIVAAVAAVLALILGGLWISASGAVGDAEKERDDARSLLAANVDDQRTTADALTSTQADLASAQEQIAQLEAAAAEQQGGAAEEADERVSELESEVADLTASADSLQTQVEDLTAQLEAAQQSPAASFDPATTPDFARWIGESLSSRNGSSRLSQAQSTCFGTAIVNDIGLDGVGRGLYLAASSDDNNVVVGALQRAADACGIPQDLIF